MREREKGCQKAVATVNIKISIFNFQYSSHFCMDFYATNMSMRSYILFEILLKKKRKLFTLIIHSTGAPVYTKKYIPVCISLFRANTLHDG